MAAENFVQPAIPRFDGHYDHWSMLMENFLRSKEYWTVVESGLADPAADVVLSDAQKAEHEALKLKDLKAKNYLFQAIDRDGGRQSNFAEKEEDSEITLLMAYQALNQTERRILNKIFVKIPTNFDGENEEEVPTAVSGNSQNDVDDVPNSNLAPIMEAETETPTNSRAQRIRKRPAWMSDYEGISIAMNARIIGSGSQDLILAHGYGVDQSLWDKIVPDLAEHFRVVVFDWIFSGAVKEEHQHLFDPDKYSSYDAFADDLICLIDDMNLNLPLVFIGHSMSGMIGCIASIKRPELFKRIVLIGSSPRYINADDYEGGFNKSEIDDIVSNIESDFQNWVLGFPSLVVDSGDPLSVEKLRKSLANMRPEVALSVAKTVFFSDERETLDKVSTRAL
ncbi:hypothetical protein GH714_033602 [Hevea brasiliensis]|uniref:AB hydrolase-1 domain-containing protein n=1 Tax=Hevea brasiliensis TaxID=3981 RepID=A0A6A6LUA7_HEVBR|nr:hypothetical protein GH714_033602 [Hevea brasiliensis]